MNERHYIAFIHKEAGSGYGISFPDLPGIIAVGDTLDEALAEAGIVLGFAFEDWEGEPPAPHTLEQMRADPNLAQDMADAVVAAVRPVTSHARAAE